MGSSSYFKKSQRIFTSFMKELAKKEARVAGQFFHYYFFLFLFLWMAVLFQNQFSDFLRTVPGYEIKQARALITGRGLVSFLIPAQHWYLP
jgi:hypothetical protein